MNTVEYWKARAHAAEAARGELIDACNLIVALVDCQSTIRFGGSGLPMTDCAAWKAFRRVFEKHQDLYKVATNPDVPAVPEEWRKALQEAHDTFQRYADLHQAKGTHDGYKKAKANQKLANKLYALLQSTGEQDGH